MIPAVLTTCAHSGSPGVAALDIDDCCAAIRPLRSDVDWVILQVHWGQEMCRLPSPEQRAARSMVAAGADLILGITPTSSSPASGSLAFRSSTAWGISCFPRCTRAGAIARANTSAAGCGFIRTAARWVGRRSSYARGIPSRRGCAPHA